jgi:CysZ protein
LFKKNKGIAIGNGFVFMLFLLIPFVGIIFIIPFSVTSATIATLKIINE